MSYLPNNDASREALFSSAPKKNKKSSGGVPKHYRHNEQNRDALFGSAGNTDDKKKKPKKSSSSTRSTDASPPTSTTTSSSRGYKAPTKSRFSKMSGEAKVAKMKEAKDYVDKAKKAMERGLFSRPDPIVAGNYYKRAADIYSQCGENRLERLHRVASADCQRGIGSYPTAAAEYMKAANLAKVSDEKVERKRKEGWKLYSDAADAWRTAGEMGKAANCQVQSALAWTWEDDTTLLDKQTLIYIEEAIEAHVPDVLNNYANQRQTGHSKFLDPSAPPNSEPSPQVIGLAREHLVKTPFAYEPLQEVASMLVHYGEYASALYATGAATHMLENGGIATISLSRSFVMETILALAMGDPVAAEQQFLSRHVQVTAYLTTRECKLAEDLFRAVLHRDEEGLEEARSPTGSNKAALAHLDQNVRILVTQLRISGAARRRAKPTGAEALALKNDDDSDDSDDDDKFEKLATPDANEPERTPASSKKQDDDDGEKFDTGAMDAELDDVMKGLDELDDFGDDLDDDEIDLR